MNRLGIRRNYVCRPAIVIIIMGLRGAESWRGNGGGGEGHKVILWTEAEGVNDKVKEGHFFEGS